MAEMDDQRKTEATMGEESQTLRSRALFNSIADPVFVFDQETGRFLDCNQTALDRYGYALEELRAMKPQQLHPPEEANIVERNINDPRRTPPHEYTHITKDGQILYVEVHTDEIEYEGRNAWISVVRDISGRKRLDDERKRLLATLRRRNTQLQTAAEVSRAASSILNLDELTQQVVELVRDRFDLYYAGLFLVDKTGEWTGEPDRWAVLRAGTGKAGQQMLEQGHKLEIGGSSMIGWCVANGRARIALDVGEEAVRFDNPLLPDTRSELALPLISRGQAVGALTIHSPEEAAFSEEDITVLQAMADQLANAIANAWLYDQAQQDIVERKQAEVALTHERDLLHTLMDNTPDYIFFKDRESRIIRTNAAHAQLLGVSDPKKAIGKTDFDFFPKEDAERFYAEEQRVIESQQPVLAREWQIRSRDSEAIWVSESKIPFTDEAGQVIGLVSIGRDVTERKKAEEALQGSEERLRTIMDALQIGIMVIDAETHTIVEVNSAAAETIGNPPEKIVGHVCHDFVCPTERGRCPITNLGQTVDRAERGLMNASGEHIPVLKTVTPIMLSGRKRLIESFIDITDRKQAQEALRTSEERHRMVVENANEAILVIQDGLLKFVNAKASQFTGFSKDELLSRHFAEFVHPDDRKMVAEQHLRRLKGDLPQAYPFRIVDRDGNIKWMEINAVTIPWEGQPATLNFVNDITERKQAEEALQAVREELEQYATSLERQTRQLRVASEVARDAAAIRQVPQLLDETVHLISDRFGFYHTGIFLVDAQNEYAVLRAASSEGGRRMLERGHKLRIGEDSVVGYVATTGDPRIALDVGPDAVFFDNPDLPDTRSEMTLPLNLRGRTIGVLDVQSIQETTFSEDSIAILQTLVDQLAIAIDNARLAERTEAQLRELGLLYGDYSATAWAKLASPERVSGYVYDRVDVTPAASLSTHALDLALTRSETVTMVEPGTELGASASTPATSASTLATPLKLREQIIGALGTQQTDLAREWSPDEIALVESVSEQVALALENARLFAESQKSAQTMQALYETSRVLSSTLEQETVIRTILEAVYHTLGCEHAIISTVDEKAGTIGIRHGVWHGKFDVFPHWIQASHYPLDHPDILAEIYRTGRMEIIGEWDARFNREVWEKYGHERFLRIFMPIKIRERVIGVVEVGYDKRTKGHIGEEEVQMLAAFMDQAAVALENASLFEQTQAALAETETLYAGSERLTRAVTMDDVLQALIQSTALQQIERVNLLLFDSPLLPDEQPDAFTVAAVWERADEAPGGYEPVTAGTPPAGTRYEFDQFPAARMITRHEPTAVNDVTEDARFDEISRDLFLKQLGMRSVIFWPLMIGRQWIGVLSAQARTPLRLREDETRQIGSLVDQAAVVLQNIRLLEETQRRATSLAAAAAVARDATAILDVDRLLEQTVQLISEQFGFYHAGVFFLDERDEYATLQAASSEGGRHMLEQGHKLRIGGGGIVGHVAQTGEPRIALDVGEDSTHFAHADLPNTRSEMALPLKVQDRVIGVLDVQSTTEAAFSDDHVAVLQTLADQLATAIANARLFEQVQRRARRERLIREITARVRSTVDVESILQATVQELGKALGTSYGVVRLGTEAELTIPSPHGRAGSGSGEREAKDGS